MLRIEEEVEPLLPTRPLNKGEIKAVTPPKIQFKNSKQGLVPSKAAEKFFDRVAQGYIKPYNDKIMTDTWYGYIGDKQFTLPHHEPVTTIGPMRVKNQADMKNWLTSLGWKPLYWNFKKDPKTHKAMRDSRGKLIKTTPKFHDKGTLCPHLELLGDKIELVKPVVRWLSLRNRRSVIHNPDKGTGWLANDRLQKDGRLGAGASTITNTHRQKHKIVANIPRVSSTLGKEMRELFCASEGKVLVGYDASSLEAFIKGHYCYNYEGGKEYYEKITDPDFDEHQATATAWGLTERQDAKAGNYGLQYNQGVAGLAETYSISRALAQERYDAYWELNRPWALCLDKLKKHWENKNQKGIMCHTTGHFLHSRSPHSLGSLLAQHTGAIAMDYSGALMDRWLGGIKYDCKGLPLYMYKGYEVRRVLYYHDELAFECDEGIAPQILKMGIQSIRYAGEGLKLNVPLGADGSIGHSWADIH